MALAERATPERLVTTMTSPDGLVTGAQSINVIFNQPVVPLADLDAQKDAVRLDIQPPISGTYHWMGSQTLSFRPDEPFARATRYEVRLPAGVTAISGQRLESDVRWSFETPRPRLLNSKPYNGQRSVRLDVPVLLRFNQPVALQDLQPLLQVEVAGQAVSFSLRRPDPDRESESDWAGEGDAVVLVEPDGDYPMDAAIEIRVKPGLVGQEGALASEKVSRISFRTYPPLRLDSAYCSYRSQSECTPGNRIRFSFTNPLDVESIEDFVEVSPALPPGQEIDSSYRSFSIPTGDRADVTYTVRVKPGIQDRYGNVLDAGFVRQFEFGPQFPALRLPRGQGVLEGGVGEPEIPIVARNLGEVQLFSARIPEDRIVPFAKRWRRGGSAKDVIGEDGVASWSRVKKLRYTRNDWEALSIPMASSLGDTARGVLFFEAEAAEPIAEHAKRFRSYPGRGLVQITSLGLTTKLSPDETLIWVTSLDSGVSVEGVTLRLRDKENSLLWEGTSDSAGLAAAPGMRELSTDRYDDLFVTATHPDGSVTYLNVSDGDYAIAPYQFDIGYQWNWKRYQHLGMLFTDRGVYRKGEGVYIKGIIREEKSSEWAIPDDATLRVWVRDARDEIIFDDDEVALSPGGTFDLNIELAPDAPLGAYNVYASFDADGNDWSSLVREDFRVEAYRTPEFKVETRTTQDRFIAGQAIAATAAADYYFGAPLANADVTWTVLRNPTSFRPPGDDWGRLSFIDRDRDWGSYEHLTTHAESLDRLGKSSITVEVPAGSLRGPFRYEFDAQVQDLNRQSISSTARVIVHPGELYLGVGLEQWLVPAKGPVNVEAVAVDLDGALVPSRDIAVSVARRTWKTVREKGTGDNWVYSSEPVDDVVGRCDVKSLTDARAICEVDIAEPGYYVVRAEGEDRSGNAIASSSSFYAYGSGYTPWAFRNDNRVELVVDQERYSPGDTATIMVKSPWKESTALITTEKSGVLSRRVERFSGNAEVFTVDIAEKHIPNVYVSVTLVKGRTEAFDPTLSDDPGRPDMKQGYVMLPVSVASKKLDVQVQASPEETGPRGVSEISVKVKDNSGAPVAAAEVTLYAVDEAVLALTGYATPDPMDVFYATRPVGVRMSDSRLHFFERTHSALKGEHPSGDGGGGQARYRSFFSTTAFWSGSLQTDASGAASASVELPENLTTFRVMAVVNTEDSRFGSGQGEVMVTKKLLVRSALPRFARIDDDFEASFIITNRDAVERTVDATLEASGDVKLLEAGARTVTVPAGESVELRYPSKATGEGSARFAFRADDGAGHSDGVEQSIPIHFHKPTETVATTGSTETAVMEGLTPPNQVHETVGGLQVQLASTAMVDLDGGIRYLIDYPFGCLEQTSSRVSVLLLLKPLLATFNLLDVTPEALDARVEQGIERILSMQQYSGGFAMWPSSDRLRPYASVNALFVLSLAHAHGYDVDARALERGVDFLRNVIKGRRYNAYSEPGNLALQAYALHVLARLGAPEPSFVANLFDRRTELTLLSKAHLLLAVVEGGENDVSDLMRDELITMLESTAVPEASYVQFLEAFETGLGVIWDTDVTTSGLVTYALLRARPEHPLITKAVGWLLDKRRRGRWHTTQKNAVAILALGEYLRVYEKEEPDFLARVFLGDELLMEQSFKGRSQSVIGDFVPMRRIASEGDTPLIVGKEGVGRLYYSMRLTYAPGERNLPPREEGFSIERTYESLETGEPITTFEAGEVVLVRLTVATPVDRRNVAINDPLPAGLEPVNLRFKTESPNLRRALGEASGGSSYSWYRRFLFDHVEQNDDAVQIFSDHLSLGVYEYTYLARATSYGAFTAPPAHVEEMYAPEIFGRTATEFVTVE